MLPETIAEILRALNRNRVPYIFFGMEAINEHLDRRGHDTFSTKDSDFLIDLKRVTPTAIIPILRSLQISEEIHILWKTPDMDSQKVIFDGRKWLTKNMKIPDTATLSIYAWESPYHIDLAFFETCIAFQDLLARSEPARYHGVPIRIANEADLIKLKEDAGREKDEAILSRIRPLLNRKPAGNKKKNRGRRER